METRTRASNSDLLVKRYLPAEMDNLRSGQYNAIYRAKVINTNDPQNRGRVRVRVLKFDTPSESDENYTWSFVLALNGGPQNSGICIIPPIGSIGFIAYLDGDGSTPIWLGTSNLQKLDIKKDGETRFTIPALPVEMDNDPTTIVWKTQYPTRSDDKYNMNFYADGDDSDSWIKSENLLKLSENEFTILKYNQGRTSNDGYEIGYTYNYEPYSIDDDVVLEGEISDDSDRNDPLNNNYSNFFRIQDDEIRLFYKTKVTKRNENQEDTEFASYSSIWMDDDGVHMEDIWNNSINLEKDGIHIIASGLGSDNTAFDMEDDWGNFIKMQKNGMWVHGANATDNPQVSDPTGSYEYGDSFEVLRFNNETPGLLVNTLGEINIKRVDTSNNPLETISVDSGILKFDTANDKGSISIEPQLITITDSLGTLKLDANDTKSDSMNFKVNVNANAEINANAKVKIIGNAKVSIGSMVDLGAAVASVLNQTALIISPPGVSGGPCSMPSAGQVFVKA